MARLPDEIIERIKQEVSLVRLVQSQGHTLKKHGKDYLGHCPFHEDKTPSFVISPKNNLWHCLGACNEGGSVIDFVMKVESLDFRHAVERLVNEHLAVTQRTPVVRGAGSSATDQPEKTDSQDLHHLAASEDEHVLLQRVVKFYHETLKQSPEALDYLESRGLNDPDLIEHFKLGYANRSLGCQLPEKNRKIGAELRSRLQGIGILRDSGHEHFNGSLVIPVISEHGRVTELYGRKLLNNLRKGTPKHLYLPGPHEGVFNLSSFSGSKEMILCESLIDALTFWRHGFKNVTTSYGIAGFTDELFDAFKQHDVKRVLIAYDRDDAGNKAADELAKRLIQSGMECYRVLFPKGMDANDYACKMSPARKSLELVIRKAEWLGKGKDPRSTAAAEHTPEPLPALTAPAALEPPGSSAAHAELPASPRPETFAPVIEAQVTEQEITLRFDTRQYRVRGLPKNMSYEQLKINCRVTDNEAMHLDNLDLYSAKQRYSFGKQAAIELGVTEQLIKQDLAKVLLKLEQLQEAQIQKKLQPKEDKVILNTEEQHAALALLTAPDLLDRILSDFKLAGVVGEETNKLMGYLAAVSRKLDNPLAIVVQSTSAAGKSALMNAVLAMVPEEERIQYSAMTGQSLFYMGETHLKHKILAIAEEEGADQASYALKLLQSEGELTMASTGKDEATGNLVTREYRVEGPVMLFSTTTAIDIDEELMNRCIVLTVNESREQTQLIHQMQRRKRTLSGLKDKAQKQTVLTLHRNAQRLLRSLQVVNPYADELTFLSDKTRTRRDHEKYLTLIDAIALLHQYQRAIKTDVFNGKTLEYIEVTLDDIDLANRLAHEVLGRSQDELPPQTRQLLKRIREMVLHLCDTSRLKQNEYRFSRKQIREFTGWSDNQLKVHCRRLEELEYLLIHKGGRGQSLVYELLYDGALDSEQAHLMGLIDTRSLDKGRYDAEKLGVKGRKMAPSCPQVGSESGPSWSDRNGVSPCYEKVEEGVPKINGKTHSIMENHRSSYRSHILSTSSPLAAQGSEA